MNLDRKLHCCDFENLNSAKYFTNSKFLVSGVSQNSDLLAELKSKLLQNLDFATFLQSPDRHFVLHILQNPVSDVCT